MPVPEQHGELEFVTVGPDRVDEAVASVKTALPDAERACSECGYRAAVRRWGMKTYGTADPDRIALVLCCPGCEAYTDLPFEPG